MAESPPVNNATTKPAGSHAPARGGYSRYGRRSGGNPNLQTDEKQLDERVVYVNRVARVVRGGRRFRFQALVVAGDHKGKVGIGVSKGADVSAAVNKATDVAKKSMATINMHNGTLTHDTQAKIGGAKILIMPAAPGTGLIAGGVVRTVLEVTGIENALSKSLGSSNRINTAYATLSALKQTEPYKNWVIKPQRSKAKTDKTE